MAFDIIFRGDILTGHNIQDVKARLSQLFKVDAAKVEALFTGGAVPLKRNVDEATAEKYKAVLTKAGAQVQIRPAGSASKAKSTARSAPPVAGQARPGAVDKAGKQPPTEASGPGFAGSEFTLAPPGSSLLSPAESRKIPELDLDLSAISVKPMEGHLLEDVEKARPAAADIQINDYEVAVAGSDLLEGFHREELPLPDIAPDFGIAERGVDLLEPAQRTRQVLVKVDVDHLDVLPLED